MRPSIALAALALTLGSLTACGSDSGSGSAYCKELKADKAYFKSFSGSNPDVSKLDDAFNRLTQALKDAGISFGDIAKMQQGQIPKGVDPQKLSDLAPKLQAMGSDKVKKASDAIEKHAKDTCKVTLGSS